MIGILPSVIMYEGILQEEFYRVPTFCGVWEHPRHIRRG